jgi:hypothetical protein
MSGDGDAVEGLTVRVRDGSALGVVVCSEGTMVAPTAWP